jgi:glycosyltransferase involved in cell wall biosynthesis
VTYYDCEYDGLFSIFNYLCCMNQPLVSIITPTYNHEKYIADCIRSAQAQTYSNWEMIIVDDGSTDSTYSVAKQLSLKDNRIKVFTQSNVGIFRLAVTYNFALSRSLGKYIAVLEGDDVWLPRKLELQIASLEDDENVVLSWGQAYSSTSDLSENYSLHPTVSRSMDVVLNNPVRTASKDLMLTCFIPALTVVVRKDSLTRIGGFIQVHNLPLVDLPTWQQLALIGNFSFIDQPIGKWRIYPNQVTKTYTAEMAEGFYKLALDYYNQNKEYYIGEGVTEDSIHNHYRKLLVINYSRSGRYKLIKKDFLGARKDYYKSIFSNGYSPIIWKLRSVVGVIFSFFHADVEMLAKLKGGVSYK